jgi:hypothetical protein
MHITNTHTHTHLEADGRLDFVALHQELGGRALAHLREITS